MESEGHTRTWEKMASRLRKEASPAYSLTLLQNYNKINFCVLGPPATQPQPTHTPLNEEPCISPKEQECTHPSGQASHPDRPILEVEVGVGRTLKQEAA
jgi:hypothetical protein